jgi:hypothetical protein
VSDPIEPALGADDPVGRPDAVDAAPAPDEMPATGVASADAAAQRLSELTDAPVEAHVGIYEDVHHRLQEGLADLDEQ